MKDDIGTHYSNDRANLYAFERNSRIPRGYFDGRRVSVDAIVVVFVALCLLVGLLVA